MSVTPRAYGPPMPSKTKTAKTVHRCTECGCETPRWLGRCPECDAWGTLGEAAAPSRPPAPTARVAVDGPVPIAEVDAARRRADAHRASASSTGCSAAGSSPGSVTLLGGEPGIGKTTLLLQALGRMAARGTRCLLVTRRGVGAQVRLRAERLGALAARPARRGRDLAAARRSPTSSRSRPDVLAVDSIQTVARSRLARRAGLGHPGARRARTGSCSTRRSTGCATVLVGHVTKDGTLAGPRVLEHVVDTVLSFEGDRHHALRMLRALKHRFGSHRRARAVRDDRATGSSTCPTRQRAVPRRPPPGRAGLGGRRGARGHRPLLRRGAGAGRADARRRCRVASAAGIDGGRLAMLLAVLEQHAGVDARAAPTSTRASPAACASPSRAPTSRVALAVAGAQLAHVTARDTVAVGEVGLGGEVRQVPQLDAPARRGGAARVPRARSCPRRAPARRIDGLELVEVEPPCATSVGEALIPAALSTAAPGEGLRYLRTHVAGSRRESPPCPPSRDRKP